MGVQKKITKEVRDTVSFRVPEHIVELLDEIAEERKDGSSKPSPHKEARRIFAHGLKELYGVDLA